MSLNVEILLVTSILGILDTVYIYYKHKTKTTMTCPLQGHCVAVMESKWSRILGIRTELFGLAFYLLMAGAALGLLYIPAMISNYLSWLVYINLAGLLVGLYLFYIQMKVIKQYCFYCLISDFLIIVMLINFGTMLR